MGGAGVGRLAERPDHDLAPRQALAHVVVRLPFELEVHRRDGERTEALAGAAAEAQPHVPDGEGVAAAIHDASGDARADGQVVVADVVHAGERPAAVEARLEHAQDFLVERLDPGAIVPRHGAPPRCVPPAQRVG